MKEICPECGSNLTTVDTNTPYFVSHCLECRHRWGGRMAVDPLELKRLIESAVQSHDKLYKVMFPTPIPGETGIRLQGKKHLVTAIISYLEKDKEPLIRLAGG
jgi:hypothetical protein